MPIVPALDGFRAYAILGVVTIHLLLATGAIDAGPEGSALRTLSFGLFGNVIDAFFIVSGFVIFLPVVVRHGELGGVGRFALGRVARLIPAYWFCLAVLLALLAIVPLDYERINIRELAYPSPADIAAHLAALQMPVRLFEASFPLGFGIDGPLWMISIIVGFYVVFPFIARAYFRHPITGLIVAAAVTVGWKEAVLNATGFFEALQRNEGTQAWVVQLVAIDQRPGWVFSFALGMTAAWSYVRLRELRPPESLRRPALLLAAGALAACAVCAYLYGRDAAAVPGGAIAGSSARSDVFLTLAYTAARGTLMVAIVLGPLWMRRPFANRTTARLAELAYGVYLIHLVIAIYVGALWLDLPTDGSLLAVASWFGIVVPLSLAYAVVSNRFVERPARRWVRRVTPPPRVRPAREPIPAPPASAP